MSSYQHRNVIKSSVHRPWTKWVQIGPKTTMAPCCLSENKFRSCWYTNINLRGKNHAYRRHWLSQSVQMIASLEIKKVRKVQSYQVTNWPSYQVSKFPSYHMNKLPSYQITKISSYQANMFQSYQVSKLTRYQDTKLLSYHNNKLLSYQVTM